ncbi:cysteine/glutathione ABC transporter ATP-binding protein/permease CydC [Candidatus Sodalis endolongispinus]|uniref:Cysteine/glutathione ABC transporter ATP-binding protein/permease CydC n=1 Tax=Candidatus Sodalis endolongispinus TaxID=2812662 RepID=A0ABS5YEH5_9GAMM|nr:cysteine/glutathione ABC transporter ATP-binding protein/permease CydC [Candidatus Sodalis endolongispinus]MBT9433341.1 cysteine/glutathione ABC transporter ATP-binding protein/permease CydC [Candidatus Sodalis endolongispinus]
MRTLLPYLALYRRHGGQLTLGVLLAIITLLASIGLLTLSGLFLAGAATAGAAGLYSFNYMLPAAGVRGAAITRTAGRWAERVVSHDATFRVLQHLRLYTFSRILPLSPGATARLRRGELLNRLVADVDTLDHLYLRVISPLAGALVVTLTVSAALCLLDPRAGLTLGAIMLAILALLPPLFYRAGKPVGEALTALRADYRLQLTAWLSGNAELTLYGAAERYRHRLEATEQRWQALQRRQSGLGAGAQSLLLGLTGLTLTWVLWQVAGDGPSGPLIALFAFATLAAFEALGPVAVAFQHLGQVIACAVRLNALVQQPPEVIFPAAGPAPAAGGALVVRRVRFHYPEQVAPAIDDLTLAVAAGEHIALLGHTGSGKSTLLQLLTRAWDPQEGEIKLNDVPLREWSESALRAMTAVVEQRVHIFSATLRDNLRLAAPDADDEQLCTVVRQVGLDKLLTGEGLNAWLGEGGRALSGGEQRRMCIARALLRDAPLWLLDEPTEGLDAVTEQQILHLLGTLGQGRTVIIVTHRLRGLERLDRICILDRGTLIEQGSHQALMAQRGRYYHYHRPVEVY